VDGAPWPRSDLTMTTRKGDNITRSRRQNKVKTQEFFEANPVFSLDDATRALRPASGRLGTVQRLKHHLRAGRLKRVTRGVYAVVAPGSKPRTFEADPFLVAQAIRPDAIFSHHAAFELLGAAHSVWRDCTVYTSGRQRVLGLTHGSIRFLRHPAAMKEQPLLGTRRVERRGRLLSTTGQERTLIESFRWPALAGGLGEVVESAGGFPVLDLDLVEELLGRYRLSILWAAVGWFLEFHRDTFHVTEVVLHRLESHRPKSPQYLARGLRGGVLQPRWNLIVPESVNRLGEPDEPGA